VSVGYCEQGATQCLNPLLKMRKEIDALPIRLQALKAELRECDTLFDAEKAATGRIEQHKDRLALRLPDAQRAGSWDSIRTDFLADWNSLVVDLELLEKWLYE